MVELIYCANGNARYAQIAIDAGMRYGAQLPGTVYHPVWFADQNWRKPDRARYITALAQHKPHMATVLDLEQPEQMALALAWAEEAAAHVQELVIIPKYSGAIAALPRVIGNKRVRLGYSVPTRYGGTSVPLWEFGGWPVHLLGGGVTSQLKLRAYLDVWSADGNLASKVADKGMVFDGRRWVRLEAHLGARFEGDDMTYMAFGISCRNTVAAWQQEER